MDIREAEQQVEQLAEEWVTQERLALSARRNSVALSKIVLGYLEMYPQLADVVARVTGGLTPDPDAIEGDGKPRGVEAVRRVLQDRPNFEFWVSEVVDDLRNRGWLPDSENPANAARTSLERLVSIPDADVYKTRYADGKVTYSYQPDRERPSDAIQAGVPLAGGYDDFGEEPF